MKQPVQQHAPGIVGRPFTGAWIETFAIDGPNETHKVAPSRGRGLKPQAFPADGGVAWSPLHGGVD